MANGPRKKSLDLVVIRTTVHQVKFTVTVRRRHRRRPHRNCVTRHLFSNNYATFCFLLRLPFRTLLVEAVRVCIVAAYSCL